MPPPPPLLLLMMVIMQGGARCPDRNRSPARWLSKPSSQPFVCRLANSLYSRHPPLLAALMFPAVAAFPLWDARRLCGMLQAAPGIQAPIRRLYRWAATAQ